MKLTYPYNPTNPITSTEDYLRRRAIASASQDWRDFSQSLPHVLISRCPYCNREIWMEAGLMFSLTDNFWFRAYSDGGKDIVTASSLCKHLFCVDGALNLNGNQPTEAKRWHNVNYGEDWNYIWVASEVPFVKPRVLQLPTMLAVIHTFPIAEGKYTAYPIVYFAEQQPKVTEYCVSWAAKRHFATGVGPGVSIIGRRSDMQDYDLNNWVQRGLLFWLDLEDDEYTLIHARPTKFPYQTVPGRRHPYIIKDGQLKDLPARTKQGKPDYIFEHDSEI